MTEDGFPFDEPTFEEEAEPESVRGHRLEAEYGEFYAEIIGDGEITPEQRERLDRAAETIGLDSERVQRIEQGIQAAYDARREARSAGEDSARTPVFDALAPFAQPTDPRLFALQRRIDLRHRLRDHFHVTGDGLVRLFERCLNRWWKLCREQLVQGRLVSSGSSHLMAWTRRYGC